VLECAVPVTDAGTLDAAKLKETVDAELKSEVDYLEAIAPTGRVVGLGSGFSATDPKAAGEAADKSFKEGLDNLADVFLGEDLGGDKSKRMREHFVNGRG
jgi:hypothetical protein